MTISASSEDAGREEALLARCDLLQRQRRLVGKHLGFALSADPIWDMLLELYAGHMRRYALSLSSLAAAANVPPTTALRGIRVMEHHQLVERQPDHRDGRRIYVVLTPAAILMLETLFLAMERPPKTAGPQHA